MILNSHLRISNKVLEDIGIPHSSPEGTSLRDGVVTPDNWKDYPHHYGKSRQIRKNIIDARRSFLDDALRDACFRLGVTFHYIQDAHTSFVWNSWDHEKGCMWHKNYEQWINESHFTDDLKQLVEKKFPEKEEREQKEWYLSLAKTLSNNVEGKSETIRLATLNEGRDPRRYSEWGKPEVDLNFAYKTCLLVAKSVLSSRTNHSLQKDLDLLQDHWQLRLQESETSFADQLTELSKKQEQLSNSKKKGGFRGFLPTIHFYANEFRIRLKQSEYQEKTHLKRTVRKYLKTANRMGSPFVSWYLVKIPEIDLDSVQRELITTLEASKAFNLPQQTIRDLIEKGRLTCYNIRSNRMIKRKEIGTALRPFS